MEGGEVGDGWKLGATSEVEDSLEEAPPGEASPSLKSDGAGVHGGVSGMLGIGWSLKQADS